MSDEIEVIEAQVVSTELAVNGRYPAEQLDEDDDDGTIVDNVKGLEELVVGRRIIGARQAPAPAGRSAYGYGPTDFLLELDNGTVVRLINTDDCCAGTELEAFLLHPEAVDHIITGVGTTDYYQTWHIFADFGDVLQMTVNWSCGNPFYYGYGFKIEVEPLVLDAEVVAVDQEALGGGQLALEA